MSYPIGTVLTRRDPLGDALDEIKVVGGDNKSLSVQPNKEFGEVVRRSAAEIRAAYTTDNIDNSTALNAPTYVDPGKTPEEIFNDASRASDVPVKPNAATKVAAANAVAEAAAVAVEADAAGVEAEAVKVEAPEPQLDAAAIAAAALEAEGKTEAQPGDQHATKKRRNTRRTTSS